MEILLQPGRYYKPKIPFDKNDEMKADNSSEMEDMKKRIEHLENIILQQSNNQ